VRANKGKTVLDWAEFGGAAAEEVAGVLREHMEREDELAAAGRATTALAEYHAAVDVERVDLVLTQRLLAWLYSEGEFAEGRVRRDAHGMHALHACVHWGCAGRGRARGGVQMPVQAVGAISARWCGSCRRGRCRGTRWCSCRAGTRSRR
jgi:hypothetical protein